MAMANRKRGEWLRGLAATVAVVGLSVVVGCGSDDEIGKRYPVSGTVKYKGEPVPKGLISFIPADPEGRPASGNIVDGSYTLSTLGNNDGALAGKYRITISAKDIDESALEKNQMGGAAKQDDVAKAFAKAKDLVPVKYSIIDTSGLEAEVPDGKYDFDLTD